MSSRPLPERPDLTQLRKQARDLQRAARAADPDALAVLALVDPAGAPPPSAALAGASAGVGLPGVALNRAQLAVARSYGFASWARLRHHVEAIHERTWVFDAPASDEPPAEAFLRLACLRWDEDPPERRLAAAELLAAQPQLVAASIAAAAAAAAPAAIDQHLARDPGAAARPAGPYGWTPLMYLAYSRLEPARLDPARLDPARLDPGLQQTLDSAQMLLDAGADPNDGRFFLGLPVPFTVLTGVLGGGEHGQPAHPHCLPLARLLLSRGADPNDAQTLYNRMFAPENDFLELLFEFGLGQGDGGPWRRRLPDLLDSPPELLRRLLAWAVTHDQRERVALLAMHGVDIVAPLAGGASPISVALANGHRELAQQLRELGAPEPALDPVEQLVAALLAGDARAVRAASPEVLDAARQARPGLVVWAAGQQRLDAVELLVATGWDVNAMGRSDVPLEQPWHTALHAAVERADVDLVRRLLDLGADTSRRDARFDATPAGWAEHLGHRELLPLVEAESQDAGAAPNVSSGTG